jgi:TonB-linked SusC/RagA family outer membrane protein
MLFRAIFKRRCRCLLLLFLVFCSAKTRSQNITLILKNEPIEKAFRSIEAQTSYRFVYAGERIRQAKPVTVRIENLPLPKALITLFTGQPLTYSIQDNYILVKEKAINEDEKVKDVSGRVTDEKGVPIPGATVAARGSSRMTATDEDGSFTLTGLQKNAVIVISSVGYLTEELPINERSFIEIQLSIAVQSLDETVIKGYYNTSKRLNTGSVSKLTALELERQPVNNALQALEGRMPGVIVTQSSGISGSAMNVQIRGRNSLRIAGNDPLYVVDGVPFTATPLGSSQSTIINGGSPLANLNPADIESIEVLKDADATAIYGSRGANGVVLITTKKGKAGKTKADVIFTTGIAKVARTMKLLNTEQYLQMRHEAFANDGLTTIPATAYDMNGTWDTTRYTDWQKAFTGGTAHITNVQASVSGGNEGTQFMLGGGYYHETTVFPFDFGDKKASFHANLTHHPVNSKFQAQMNASYMSDINNLPSSDPTSTALSLAPDAPPLYKEDGMLNWITGFSNPMRIFLRKNTFRTDNLIGSMVLSYELFPNVTLKSNMGYTKIQMNELQVIPKSTFNPTSNITSGNSYFGNSSSETWIVEPQIEMSRQIAKGKLNVLLGTTFQEDEKRASLLNATGFLDDELLDNISNATTITKVTTTADNNYYRQYKYNAVFARLNYNWESKYLVNLTARRDGSSRFGPGKQFANFGAVGIGWIFSKEKWASDLLPALSYGKLRASYGITGNDQIPDYGFLSTYSTTTYPYNANGGLYPNRLFNADYAWETNHKLEAALELGIWNNRLVMTIASYRNRSSNQLVGYALPGITGFTSIQFNSPATVQNWGWEFEVSATPLKKVDFSWTTAINLSIPRNKLVTYPDLQNSSNSYLFSVGKPLSSVFAYEFEGIDPQTGMYTFKDADKNGSLALATDGSFSKTLSPEFYGGFQNEITYKNIEFSCLFQFVKQSGRNYMYNYGFAPGMAGNQPDFVLDRWQNPGEGRSIQRFTQSVGSAYYAAYVNAAFNSDLTISDASYIRLKNLSLSYVFNDKWKQKMHVQNLRLFLKGQNLWTHTHYLGLDPETQSRSNIPPLKVWAAGIQLTL